MLKYNQVMEHIRSDVEMQARVLDNVLASTPEQIESAKRAEFSIQNYLPYLALVAALAWFFVFPKFFSLPEDSEMNPALDSHHSEESDGLAELGRAIGVSIPSLDPPFAVKDTTFNLLFGEIAEVLYTGEGGESLLLRVSQGNEDNSGDYNAYTSIIQLDYANHTVLLKGETESYRLAIWALDGFSYSIASQKGLSQSEWESILKVFLK